MARQIHSVLTGDMEPATANFYASMDDVAPGAIVTWVMMVITKSGRSVPICRMIRR